MKKPKRPALIIGAVLVLFVAILIAETLIVKVRTTHLRKEPNFFAPTIAVLNAGESLEKLGTQDSWFKVRTSKGLEGWVHSTAVQAKKFSLFAMDKSLKTQATASEVALAGKGFNKQVEDKYKTQHKNVSFVWVDRMLKIKVSPARMKDFLQKGKLGEFGGQK